MKIFIGSDHGGFVDKNKIIEELKGHYEIEDMGPFVHNPDDDYPDFALKVAEKVSNEAESRGILICRSGNGMCIAANKVKGCYAALAFTSTHASKAVEDDNANIVCLDADYEGEDVVSIVRAFLETSFAGMDTRHGRRFQKILNIENQQI